MNNTRILAAAIAALSLSALLPCCANADDAPGPCASLTRIVAAAPDGLASLTPDDGRGVAQPYGDAGHHVQPRRERRNSTIESGAISMRGNTAGGTPSA
ncbi:hypothetical protein GCM10011400_32420 [Paraburkholderia caffeinilytica]|uniref:Lipoprotein n=1 Tax=Paraburkholderia caffeinilytica TaxID=1761016 RepID=A0ABQ1MQX7_9BURK|nr:hypothetical protein GCM10011400_32420 [Paraburkholderia caffeinilytica]CAB3790679.1 hypothetical protein LMG28690_03143 [Paraburkholderia caffeinilytica]